MKPDFVWSGRRFHMVLDRDEAITVCGFRYDLTDFHRPDPRELDMCYTCKHYMDDDFWGPITSYVDPEGGEVNGGT